MSDKDKFPLILLETRFIKSVVISIPCKFDPTKAYDPAPQNAINVKLVDAEKRLYEVVMSTVCNPEKTEDFMYHIDMECVAFFEADSSLSNEEAQRGILITGHSVLYGAIREAVLWSTSRQVHGAINLGLSVLRSAPNKDK